MARWYRSSFLNMGRSSSVYPLLQSIWKTGSGKAERTAAIMSRSHPRLYFSLIRLKPRLHGLLDVAQQHVDTVLHPEVGPDVNNRPLAADRLPERLALQPGVQVPPGRVQSALGKEIACDPAACLVQVLAAVDPLSDQQGREDVPRHRVDTGRVFRTVGRLRERGRLSPAHGYRRRASSRGRSR